MKLTIFAPFLALALASPLALPPMERPALAVKSISQEAPIDEQPDGTSNKTITSPLGNNTTTPVSPNEDATPKADRERFSVLGTIRTAPRDGLGRPDKSPMSATAGGLLHTNDTAVTERLEARGNKEGPYVWPREGKVPLWKLPPCYQKCVVQTATQTWGNLGDVRDLSTYDFCQGKWFWVDNWIYHAFQDCVGPSCRDHQPEAEDASYVWMWETCHKN
ncbi:hypothetical protein DL766_007503 [Monosporascus sp. MC13-8B]|uniref:Uncharacterized protein n=1 Tax=Monosporascus cannonballus TaxID=155416 RepID=A0ABY0GZA7_9PEZI|nr:hypothetical protein DL762_007393 [Monosporascus cannonballus]RYO85652.1 hypothetical protein DL763_007015 [Monosporascus cannonballus]RYP23498.1 hypothetical protein DL766_007503 [Monosporascus sp. MC13-8B]